MRVAVAIGQAQQLAVTAEYGEVDTPCVDTDRVDLDAACGDGLQSVDNRLIYGRQIPVEMAAHLYYGVRKTVDLLHRDGAAIDCREYDAAAGCSQINRDETVCRHILGSFRFALQNYPIISSLCHWR